MAAQQWTRVVVAAVLLGLAPVGFRLSPAAAGTTDCVPTLPQCTSGECIGIPFTVCRTTPQGCACVPFVCCLRGSDGGAMCQNITESECISLQGTPVANSACISVNSCLATRTPSATPTTTPTASPSITPARTATATPTNTPVPNGGECMTPSQCASGICISGICQGPTAGVPATSSSGLLLGVIVLVALGGLALLRRLRSADSE